MKVLHAGVWVGADCLRVRAYAKAYILKAIEEMLP